MTFRAATLDDCRLLAELNHRLIRDEGNRNPVTVAELEDRMRGWLSGEYRAIIYEERGEVVAYALFREEPDEVYLRHLYVVPHRRSQGLGRRAVEMLRSEVWPRNKRLTVAALLTNHRALAFWRKVGYVDYSLTLEILPSGKLERRALGSCSA